MAVDRGAVLKRAAELVSEGKLDLAIAEYRVLVDEQPDDVGAANALGDLYARTGNPASAVAQFLRLADSERAQGFAPKAIAFYKKALRVDPGCEEALSQLAEIAIGQELLADATLYWNRLVQHRRARNDAAGVAQALIRLASLPVAKPDTKLAAARAAEPHVEAEETARLYGAAAEALARDGRAADAGEAWLEAAKRTADAGIRHAAARACLQAGRLDRAMPFLDVEVAGDEPALLWAVGERAAAADDEAVAVLALERYRALVPDDGERVTALLAKWQAPAPDTADEPEASHEPESPADVETIDLGALLAEAPSPAPASAPAEATLDGDAGPAMPPDSEPQPEPDSEPEVIEVGPEASLEEATQEIPVQTVIPPARDPEPPGQDDDAAMEADEADTIAQLQAAAETPALQFQASAQLGRWFLHRGELERGIEWLERASAAQAPIREHGLALLYDLADALERAGQHDRALNCWSDLEFEAGSYRDVSERLARLTRAQGSSR